MTVTQEQTVGQVVAENPARARVFEKHRIDFCCGGKLPISEACERRGVELAVVLEELALIDAGPPPLHREWTKAPLTELASHIVDTHHAYLRTELPRLGAMAARVAKVHGDHAPETINIESVFAEMRAELEEHMMKEEQILFPWVAQMEGGQAGPFGASVANPIACMEKEHEDAGAALAKLRYLTNEYQPPMDACNTWRVLYAGLEVLEQDMHVHVHKENSILFPRALELEHRAG